MSGKVWFGPVMSGYLILYGVHVKTSQVSSDKVMLEQVKSAVIRIGHVTSCK